MSLTDRRTSLALIVIVAALSYASSITAPFLVYDDQLYILDNGRLNVPGLAGFLLMWNPHDALHGKFIEFFPLRDSVYWLLWQAFGPAPLAFHVVNVAFHAAASILVGVLAVQLRLSLATSLCAALLFAVHPVHIESVAWIAALKDPMYTTFLLGSVICYGRYIDTQRRSLMVGALLLLVCSLLTKSLGFPAPGLFLALEWTRRGTHATPWPTLALRLALPAAVAIGFVVLFISIGRAAHVIVPPHGGSWTNHYVLVVWVFARYVQQSLVPYDFQLMRCFATPEGLLSLRFFVGILAVIAYAAAVWRARRAPIAFFLLAWFALCLLPVMNLVPFPAVMADRYLYAPSVAVCIGLAVAVERLPERLRIFACVACVLTFGLITAARGSLWLDEANLWRNVIASDEDCAESWVPYTQLGEALLPNDPEAALNAFHDAMNNPKFDGASDGSRCAAHISAARAALALNALDLALRHSNDAKVCADNARVWAVVADVAFRRGDVATELEATSRVAELVPAPSSQWNRGLSRFRAGQVNEAAQDLASAIAANPGSFCPRYRAWLQSLPEASRAPTEALVGTGCQRR